MATSRARATPFSTCQLETSVRISLRPPIPVDGEPWLFQPDLPDPDFVPQQWQEIDLEPGLLGGNDIRAPIADVDILQGDEQTGEEADTQVGVDVQEERQGGNAKGKEPDEDADGNGEGSQTAWA